MSVETFIGWRYLKSKRKQTFISIISFFSLGGVALGVAALIVVLAVMTGTEEEMKDRILEVNSHIIVLKYGQQMDRYEELLPVVGRVKGVVHVEPFIYGQVMIGGRGGMTGGAVRGVDTRLAMSGDHLSSFVKGGKLSDLEDGSGDSIPKVILGKELAKQTKTEQGEMIRIITPTGNTDRNGQRKPKAELFKVVGIFDSGMNDYDSTLAYVSLSRAQEFLGLGDYVTGLEIMVDDVYRADRIREHILAELGPSYWARDWMQMNHNLFTALKLQKAVMFIILSLTILVAAFNIISTLIMVVMEKKREIAMLRSMGATRWLIMKIFIFQGIFLGLVGTAAGLIIGGVLCAIVDNYRIVDLPPDVYYISTLPVRLQFLDVSLIVLSALGVSFLATLYPAWQAARGNPVEALRYE